MGRGRLLLRLRFSCSICKTRLLQCRVTCLLQDLHVLHLSSPSHDTCDVEYLRISWDLLLALSNQPL